MEQIITEMYILSHIIFMESNEQILNAPEHVN